MADDLPLLIADSNLHRWGHHRKVEHEDMMTDEEFEQNKDNMAPYTFENGKTYYVFKRSALFCDQCTDIFYDSDGPYMFVCNKREEGEDIPGDVCLSGNCEFFTHSDISDEIQHVSSDPEIMGYGK